MLYTSWDPALLGGGGGRADLELLQICLKIIHVMLRLQLKFVCPQLRLGDCTGSL